MEPISVIMGALSLGIAAGLKPTAEQAVKDAYQGLKALIQKRYSVSLDNLEQKPDSKAQQAAIEEALTDNKAETDKELITQAQKVVEEVEKHDAQVAQTIGVNLVEVKSKLAEFKNIRAGEGAIGVNVEKSEIDELKFGDVDAGNTDSKN